jgi:hypothetical protein
MSLDKTEKTHSTNSTGLTADRLLDFMENYEWEQLTLDV